MTQQPYAPQPVPQYPQAPQQGYPAQQAPATYQQPGPQPQYPQQPYQAPQQQPYAGQPYQQPAPPQQPQQPLVQGTLADYYNQPTSGGGPSISWSRNGGTVQLPLGTTYLGIVARDVSQGDVQHDTDPKTGAGKFYRDGRARFVMKVPLKSVLMGNPGQQPGPNPQEFPEGEASWFVRGQARDELTRAQTAAGLTGDLTPKEGDVIQITLIERRPSRGGGMPANVVQVSYQPGPRWGQGSGAAAGAQEAVASSPAPAQASQPAAAPAQQAPEQQYQQPVQQQAPQFAQQQVAAYTQQPGPAQPVEQQGPPPTWATPPVQQQAPQQLPAPAGLDQGQQELLARLQAQQAAAQ